MIKTLSELDRFLIKVLEHWSSVGSQSLSHYFEDCNLCQVYLGKGKVSNGGGGVRKGEVRYKGQMELLCSLCHLPQAITRRKGTLQVFSELVLFYRRWKGEEKESWNPCLGSNYSNFEVEAANFFSENYPNSNIFNGPSVESKHHPIIPIPF